MWILDNPYNPFLLAFLGCVACLGAFVAWIMSSRKEALYAAAGIFVLFAILIMTERMMISDREAIEATLIRIAADLEANKYEKVYAAIHPLAVDHLTQAQAELPGYRFSECRITKIQETKVDAAAKPKTAIVEFNIVVKGTFKQGADVFSDMTIPRFVRLNLEQDSAGEWKVKDYYHDSPEKAIMQNP